jgi:hypothetical protein
MSVVEIERGDSNCRSSFALHTFGERGGTRDFNAIIPKKPQREVFFDAIYRHCRAAGSNPLGSTNETLRTTSGRTTKFAGATNLFQRDEKPDFE